VKSTMVATWTAVFGYSFYHGTTGDSAAAIIWGGCGMVFSAYQLLRVALGHWDLP
jgi:hypothetical protein